MSVEKQIFHSGPNTQKTSRTVTLYISIPGMCLYLVKQLLMHGHFNNYCENPEQPGTNSHTDSKEPPSMLPVTVKNYTGFKQNYHIFTRGSQR